MDKSLIDSEGVDYSTRNSYSLGDPDLDDALGNLLDKLVVLAKTNGMYILGKFKGLDDKSYFIDTPMQVQQMAHPQTGQPVMALGPYLPRFIEQPESSIIPIDSHLIEALYMPVDKLMDMWVKATSGLEIAPANTIVR